jgi:hypothetical protein
VVVVVVDDVDVLVLELVLVLVVVELVVVVVVDQISFARKSLSRTVKYFLSTGPMLKLCIMWFLSSFLSFVLILVSPY